MNKALASGNIDVSTMPAFLKHPQVDINSALQQRARKGNLIVVQAILDHVRIKANATSTWHTRNDEVKKLIDRNGLLTHASRNGNVELVKYLVENGADLECRAVGYPFTPPNYAITGGQLNVIKYYVEELHVDLKEDWQGAAVQLALSPMTGDVKNTEIIKYLAEKGLIDVNGRNSNGSSLLHGATKFNQHGLVEYLLSKKVNPFIRDRTGKMAWDLTHFPRDIMYKFDKEHFKSESVWFVYYNDSRHLKPIPGNYTTMFWEHGGLEKRIFAYTKYEQRDDVKLWVRLPENNVSQSGFNSVRPDC